MVFYEGHKVYMNGKYPAIFLNGRNQHIHRLQWMKYHGNIPKGYVIHHKDGNKLNWGIDNLELLSRSEHIGVKVIARKNEVELNFNSIEEAAKFCGTYTCRIQRVFKGKQNKANGWQFERM